MVNDKPVPPPSLPVSARLPINRCNLPAVILGSVSFQRHPAALAIDGVAELHRALFQRLEPLQEHAERARWFMGYMAAHFCLHSPEEAGLQPGARRRRDKADYLRMVRGWSFDPDGREGAVLKGWVESRFGLLPRHHRAPIASPDSPDYQAYLEARAAGLYNTNALEAQLDLLYAYAQYELARQRPGQAHLRLYRGVNRLDGHEVLASTGRRERVVLLNNLSSFTDRRECAEVFGDYLLEAEVPAPKVFFYNRLLPGMLKGEDEYVVIGGVYEVALVTM
jgi:NAD+--dinitrogen-reductase ADP-D-ribosyltransferase